MKVLVTGATGFIGQHLVKKLIIEGYQVSVITRDNQKARKILGPKVKIFEADLTYPDSLKNLPLDFVWLFHLAAAVSYRYPSQETLTKVNIAGSRNLLNFAQRLKHLKKIIYVSSVGVYGLLKNPPIDESYHHRPNTDYEISKEKGEQIAWEYIKKGLPVNIIQPTLVYGPGDTASGMFRLFKVVKERKFLRVGRQNVLMHPAYVDNVIDGLLLAAAGKVVGQNFIIGDNHSLPLGKLADLIAREFKIKLLPIYLPYFLAKMLGVIGDRLIGLGLNFPFSSATADFMTSHRAYKIDKARKLLGFKPPFSTQEGIKRTARWYQKRLKWQK